MSKTAVNQVIQRAISDAAFRRQLQSDAGKTLAGFDLSKDERSAITSGDPTRLTALGVDQRMSKAFGLGGLGDVSKTVASDPMRAGSSTFIDEASAAGSAAIVSGAVGEGTTGFMAPDGTSFDAGLISGPETAGPSSVTDIDAGNAAGGFNTLDAGAPSGSSSAFESTDASGGSNSFDPGAPTGGDETVTATDADTGGTQVPTGHEGGDYITE